MDKQYLSRPDAGVHGQLTPESVSAVLHHAGSRRGVDPGAAVKRLIAFWVAADEETRAWVAGRYPDLCAALRVWVTVPDGVGFLEGLAAHWEASDVSALLTLKGVA